jgi:uncharacterized protein YbbC (DUF1343 family)
MSVVLGSTTLTASGRLRGKRVGLVANPASIDEDFVHVTERIGRDDGATLAALFGPQHGYHADLQDNMIETPHAEDRTRRVPVFSLYSDTREPSREMLDGLDVLVIDLQDVGTRVYTFAYTMANCLKAAGRAGLPVIVCDRPNPIGGTQVEGPVLERGLESFVGMFETPLRHGMTIGELARLFNDRFRLGASLEVMPMKGWRREMYWDATSLPWVIPSPNMPTLDTAIVFPGQVLFEGTQLSEGRGTTRPFELVGAPWIDPERFARTVNAYALPGVHFRPAAFQPTFHKCAGETCGGVQVHVIDRQRFQPVLASTVLLRQFRAADPARFAWRDPPYEYEHEKLPIDVLAGTRTFREGIEAGADPRQLAASWDDRLAAFMKLRAEFLLY